jgi:Bacterial RNA polymerase, alpha chain C terminal domain
MMGEDTRWKRLMLDPTPELPDNTLVSQVKFPTRILNALTAAGLRTVGEVREAYDDMLLSLPDLGHGSVIHLLETLDLPSRDGVRPLGKSQPDLPDASPRGRLSRVQGATLVVEPHLGAAGWSNSLPLFPEKQMRSNSP